MKKLLTWLSKGTKIVKILKQIYKALTIASSAVTTGETVAEQTGVVNQETVDKISGIKAEERAAIAKSAEKPTATQIRDSIEEAING